MNKLPTPILDSLKRWFIFPQDKFDCQVSTQSNHSPHIRTMLLYDITSCGELIFLTRTDTQKWVDLSQCPRVAICIFNPAYGQIVIEGVAALNNSVNYSKKVTFYWDILPLEFKRIYMQDKQREDEQRLQASGNFGVISVNPLLCEALYIDKKNYLKSSREKFLLVNGTWEKKTAMPV